MKPDTKYFLVLPNDFGWGGDFTSLAELIGFIRLRLRNLEAIETEILHAVQVANSKKN